METDRELETELKFWSEVETVWLIFLIVSVMFVVRYELQQGWMIGSSVRKLQKVSIKKKLSRGQKERKNQPDYKALTSVDITGQAIYLAMYIHFYSKMLYHATRAASESLLIELHIYVGISRCEN